MKIYQKRESSFTVTILAPNSGWKAGSRDKSLSQKIPSRSWKGGREERKPWGGIKRYYQDGAEIMLWSSRIMAGVNLRPFRVQVCRVKTIVTVLCRVSLKMTLETHTGRISSTYFPIGAIDLCGLFTLSLFLLTRKECSLRGLSSVGAKCVCTEQVSSLPPL